MRYDLIRNIFEEICADDALLEDRREYMPEDLALAYDLSCAEAHELDRLIQDQFK